MFTTLGACWEVSGADGNGVRAVRTSCNQEQHYCSVVWPHGQVSSNVHHMVDIVLMLNWVQFNVSQIQDHPAPFLPATKGYWALNPSIKDSFWYSYKST